MIYDLRLKKNIELKMVVNMKTHPYLRNCVMGHGFEYSHVLISYDVRDLDL